MFRKLFVVLAFVGALLCTTVVLAGGWVEISLDEVPGEIRAGEPLTIGFMVRQHGRTPINSVSPVVLAANEQSGEEIQVAAAQKGATGHYEATLVFPSEGEWAWSITAPPFPTEEAFAPLSVAPARAAGAGRAIMLAPGLLSWIGVVVFSLAALLLALARRQRPAPVT